MLGAFLAFFPVAVGTLKGLTSVPRAPLELMASYAASCRQTLFRLRFPAAMPYLVPALRLAATASVPFAGFWLEAPESVLMARAAGRLNDPSDADARLKVAGFYLLGRKFQDAATHAAKAAASDKSARKASRG